MNYKSIEPRHEIVKERMFMLIEYCSTKERGFTPEHYFDISTDVNLSLLYFFFM